MGTMEQFTKYDKASLYHSMKEWQRQDARQDKKQEEFTAAQMLGNNWPYEGGRKTKDRATEWLVRNNEQVVIGRFSTKQRAENFKYHHAKNCQVIPYCPTDKELEQISQLRREQKRFEGTSPHRPLTRTVIRRRK